MSCFGEPIEKRRRQLPPITLSPVVGVHIDPRFGVPDVLHRVHPCPRTPQNLLTMGEDPGVLLPDIIDVAPIGQVPLERHRRIFGNEDPVIVQPVMVKGPQFSLRRGPGVELLDSWRHEEPLSSQARTDETGP